MKYNYKDYEVPLCDEMKKIEEVYSKYILDENNSKLYEEFKDAIYALSLDIKSARACNQLPPAELDEINSYYWDLLL